MESEGYEGWAIVELMGHRRLAGRVSPGVLGGAAVLRLDVPKREGDGFTTQFYSGSALYCLTPTTEEIARRLAASSEPAPVSPWELRLPAAGVDDHEPDTGEDEDRTDRAEDFIY